MDDSVQSEPKVLDCPRVGPGQGQLIFADPDPDPPDPGPTLGRPWSALLDPKVKLFLESRRIYNASGYI